MRLNKIANLVLVISVSVVIVFVLGCKKQPAASAASPAFVPIDTSNLQLVTDTEEKERNALEVEVRALARDGDFQKLESMADEFRSHKSRFKNGDWKLRTFYVAFGDYNNIGDDVTYSNLISQLESWASQQPDSITPCLALVEAYHGYAWIARGAGTADTITEKGEQLMELRIEKSFEWLGKAGKLQARQKDPAFYATALHAFLGANVDRKAYEQVFDEGVTNAPEYTALYEYKAYYLFPRWYGQPGEWEAYAREISERDDIPSHAEIYARIALFLHHLGYFYQEFSGDDQSWEELKSSFHAIEQDYPDSLEIKSTCCIMACELCDYKEARTQAKMLDGQVDLSVWTYQTNFLNAITWLNQDDSTLESQRQQYQAKQHQTN
jgi:Domain of unknown function (DUF4034)